MQFSTLQSNLLFLLLPLSLSKVINPQNPDPPGDLSGLPYKSHIPQSVRDKYGVKGPTAASSANPQMNDLKPLNHHARAIVEYIHALARRDAEAEAAAEEASDDNDHDDVDEMDSFHWGIIRAIDPQQSVHIRANGEDMVPLSLLNQRSSLLGARYAQQQTTIGVPIEKQNPVSRPKMEPPGARGMAPMTMGEPIRYRRDATP